MAAWCGISFTGYFSNPLYCAGGNLFLNGELVIELVIPDGITTINNYAFSYCTSITSVTIPDSVTTIGDSAFYWCTNLTSVTIPDSVTIIGSRAFYYCSKLTSVTIGNGLTTIGWETFYACSNLKTVYYAGTAEEWANIEIDNTDNRNSYLINATKYYYSETEPTEAGNFWHYNENGEIVVW